ncbi:MAG: hypothetical protein LBF27_24485 [Sphingobacterium sp.]|nr:hypothetical protein [Sphingobacterium sp.]
MTTTDFTAQGKVTSVIDYTYGVNKPNTVVKTTANSSNSNVTTTTTLRYPWDFTTPIAQAMVGQNIISTPLENETKINSSITLERNTFTNAQAITSGLLLLNKKELLINGLLSNQVQVTKFDTYGNPTQTVNQSGTINSYIWGYNGQYPVAEVINATYNDIAFTGFEEGDSGTWTWTGQVVKGNSNSYDGDNFLGLSSGQSISKAGLTASKKYRVSVWLWGSTPPTGYVARATIGNWTNYEKIVTGLTTFTLTYDESINGMVDNISICPLDAMMTTYTYKPFVGMTTKTDPRGFTEYYEYDSSGRLNLIKDFNGHILKDFRYHYKP